eukprot:TRINITY_DN50119_c0_g1_i1.p1 TRINITY_DN50119_c0_g1~~TRINITY_DN50119_c0_g1_i1.p1  ORF type:complete len:558 (+),score=108.48 TRINITY_DN50119_c0_g1_i1:135-1808(+)
MGCGHSAAQPKAGTNPTFSRLTKDCTPSNGHLEPGDKEDSVFLTAGFPTQHQAPLSPSLAHGPQPGRNVTMRLSQVFADDITNRGDQSERRVSRRFSSSTGPPRARRRMSSVAVDFSATVKCFLRSRKGSPNEKEAENAEEQLRRLFDLLARGSSVVALESLTEGFMQMGWDGKEAHIQQMFALADGNRDGTISWDEFKSFFRHLTDPELGQTDEDDSPECGVTFELRRTGTATLPRHRNWAEGARPICGHSVTTFVGHRERVKCVSVAPSRRVFAACDRTDATMHLFDLDSGERMRCYSGHQDTIMCVALSPDKKMMATASRDAQVLLWDATVGYVLKELPHPGVVTCCCFSEDGKSIFTGCQDNAVRKFSTGKGKLQRITKPQRSAAKGVIVSVAFRPTYCDMVAASRSRESSVQLLAADTLAVLHTLTGHVSMVWTVSFSPSGDHLLSNCEEFVRVWDAASSKCLNSVKVATVRADQQGANMFWTTSTYCSNAFAHFIVAVCSDCNAYFLHHTEGTVALAVRTRAPVYCISSSREYDELVCGDEIGNLYVIRIK